MTIHANGLEKGEYSLKFYGYCGNVISEPIAVHANSGGFDISIALLRETRIRYSGVYMIEICGKGIREIEKFRFVK